MDKYYDEVLDHLAFNYEECCGDQFPDDGETVFHYRAFSVEGPNLPKMASYFKELDPNRTANELLGHLSEGDKVAIISRFSSEKEHMQPYVDAMTQRGLNVRVIKTQTGVQDFCFLIKAQKEIIGVVGSTYFKYASLLSQSAKKAVFYKVVEDEEEKKIFQKQSRFNPKHPKLQGRTFSFRAFSEM